MSYSYWNSELVKCEQLKIDIKNITEVMNQSVNELNNLKIKIDENYLINNTSSTISNKVDFLKQSIANDINVLNGNVYASIDNSINSLNTQISRQKAADAAAAARRAQEAAKAKAEAEAKAKAEALEEEKEKKSKKE